MAKTVITDECIISFPRLVTPQEDRQGKLKYSAALVFVPGEAAEKSKKLLMAAAIEAGEEKFGQKIKAGQVSLTIEEALAAGVLRSPFRTDVLTKGYPEGSFFMNVRTERKPGCVYPWADPATGKPAVIPADKIEEVIYPGAIVRASVTAFGYNNPENKGISFALDNIQFIRDGERLDSRVAADDQFEALDAAPASLEGFV